MLGDLPSRSPRNQIAVARTGDEAVDWYLAATAVTIEGRAVLLAICEGYNDDSIDGLSREQIASVIVGPRETLSPARASAFYGELLSRLGEAGLSRRTVEVHALVVAEGLGMPIAIR